LKKDTLQINPRERKPILHSIEPILVKYFIYRYEHGFAIPLDRLHLIVKDLRLVYFVEVNHDALQRWHDFPL